MLGQLGKIIVWLLIVSIGLSGVVAHHIKIEQSALCYELFPESEATYFAVEMESRIEFIKNEDGIFHTTQLDSSTPFKKLE